MRSLVVTSAAALFFLAIPVAGAGRAAPTIAPGRLGNLNPAQNGTYATAVKDFGNPSKVVKLGGGNCTVTWKKLGLQIGFYSLSAESSACGFFQVGEVRSSKWKTTKGLKVGMPVARLRKLYHVSRVHKGPAYANAGVGAIWLVQRTFAAGPFDYPALYARVAHGKVVALGVAYPSDGA